MEPADVLDWIRLIRTENVGPVGFRQLISRYGTAREAIQNLPDLSKRGGRRTALKPFPAADAMAEMDAAQRLGARYVTLSDPAYPALLAEIEDAPPVLLVKGDPSLLSKPCVAIVGSRNASANGRKLAKTIAAGLAKAGLVVVSGLARGIDGAAHDGALSQGSTIAVVAGGIDVVYPPEHHDLYKKITDMGVVVSEMPPGTEPKAAYFPRRNRIISGLSRGVVVVEATPRSGSLITARFAADHGRDVFAVPGSPLDPRAHGPNFLIRDGAMLIHSADDILASYANFPTVTKEISPLRPKQEQAIEKNTENDIAAATRTVMAALGPSPVLVDELIRQCHVTPAVMAMVLLELELGGRLERLPGNRVALIGTV